MAGSSMVFRLFGEDVSASRVLSKVGVEADAVGSKFSKLGGTSGLAFAAVGAAIATVAVASVKMAAQFDSSMERLHTQAGVSQSSIKGLSDGVLNLAGKVGFGPTSLSEALYHIESTFSKTGLSGAKAMELLKTAADGAAVGGSNLVDTTNALDAVIVSGIGGVKSYDQAMGALNATVGTGDMTMQDLSEALGTGVTAVVKGFGVTLTDVSAALAVFGDNNIRGAEAGSQLRMAVMALAKPAKEGTANLEALGLSTTSLAKDMQAGGLNAAVVDLVKHLNDAGITGVKVGEWLTETFGKKAGVGVSILATQLGLLENAYGDVTRHQSTFAAEVAANQATLSQKWKDFTAGLQAGMVKFGQALEPIAAGGLRALTGLGSGLGTVTHALGGMRTELLNATLTVGGLWALFKGGPAAFDLVLKGLANLHQGAAVAIDSIRTLGAGSLALGGLMAGVAAGGMYLLVQGLTAYISGARQAAQFTDQVNATIAKTPDSLSAYSSAIDQVDKKIHDLSASVGGGDFWHKFLGGFTGDTENVFAQMGPLDKLKSQLEAGQASLNATIDTIAMKMTKPGGASFMDNLAVATKAANAGIIDLNGSIGSNVAAVQGYQTGILNATPAQRAMNAAIKAEADAAGSSTDKINALVTAMDALAGTNQTLLGDQIASVAAIQDFGKNIDTSSRSLDVNTAAGRTNLTAINNAAASIQKYGDEQVKAGTNVDVVNATMYQQAVALESQMTHFGFTKAAADSYIRKLLSTPGDVSTQINTPGADQSNKKISTLDQLIAGLHDKTVTIQARDLATGVIKGVNSAVASINTNVNIFEHFFSSAPPPAPTAYNGPHRASGGWASGWAMVGEAGPELVNLGRGGTVLSHRDSMGMGGQVVVNITGPVYSDSAGIKRLMTEIDREVSRGGPVPATFRR